MKRRGASHRLCTNSDEVDRRRTARFFAVLACFGNEWTIAVLKVVVYQFTFLCSHRELKDCKCEASEIDPGG
jgi:hypothetical protein